MRKLSGSSGLLLITLLGFFGFSSASYCQITMTVRQVGPDVVVQAAGSANTNSRPVQPVTNGVVGGEVEPSAYIYVSNSTSGGYFQPPSFSGPTGIGAAGTHGASTGSGDWVGIWFGIAGVLVPAGYVSGQSLSGTGTYSSTTIAALGMTPGTYTWTWGSGPNADSFVVTISAPAPSPAAVPSLSEWAQLMLGLMVMTIIGWHFHRERSY